MKGDLQVIEYLNKALRHELTAVNQYWLHYRLLAGGIIRWQDTAQGVDPGNAACRPIIERIIFLDGAPNMQTLEALHIGQTVKEAVERDLHAELDARSVYQAAASHCHSVRDYVTRDLFETLMHDEEEHVDFFGDSTRSDW